MHSVSNQGISTYNSNQNLAETTTGGAAGAVGGTTSGESGNQDVLSTPTRLSSGAVISKNGTAAASSQHHHHYHQNPAHQHAAASGAVSSVVVKRNSLKGAQRRPSLKYRTHRPPSSGGMVGGATTPVSTSGGGVPIIKRKLSHGNSLSFYGPTVANTSDEGTGLVRLLNDEEQPYDDVATGGATVSAAPLDDFQQPAQQPPSQPHPNMPIAATGVSYGPMTTVSQHTTQLYDRFLSHLMLLISELMSHICLYSNYIHY